MDEREMQELHEYGMAMQKSVPESETIAHWNAHGKLVDAFSTNAIIVATGLGIQWLAFVLKPLFALMFTLGYREGREAKDAADAVPLDPDVWGDA